MKTWHGGEMFLMIVSGGNGVNNITGSLSTFVGLVSITFVAFSDADTIAE
jgi:hypothetical protein